MRYTYFSPGLPADANSLLDLLAIDNANVFNHLVDQKTVEAVVVCRTQAVAKALMTLKETVPANTSYAITHDFYRFGRIIVLTSSRRFMPPKGQSSYRSYYMDPVAGSGMLRSTLSCLVEERGAEVRGLEVHLASLEREREQVARSRSSYEAERKRAVGQIQTLRGRVANLNSQLSQVGGGIIQGGPPAHLITWSPDHLVT